MPLSLRARRQQGLFWGGVSCGKALLGAVGCCRVLRCSLGASVRLADGVGGAAPDRHWGVGSPEEGAAVRPPRSPGCSVSLCSAKEVSGAPDLSF